MNFKSNGENILQVAGAAAAMQQVLWVGGALDLFLFDHSEIVGHKVHIVIS